MSTLSLALDFSHFASFHLNAISTLSLSNVSSCFLSFFQRLLFYFLACCFVCVFDNLFCVSFSFPIVASLFFSHSRFLSLSFVFSCVCFFDRSVSFSLTFSCLLAFSLVFSCFCIAFFRCLSISSLALCFVFSCAR